MGSLQFWSLALPIFREQVRKAELRSEEPQVKAGGAALFREGREAPRATVPAHCCSHRVWLASQEVLRTHRERRFGREMVAVSDLHLNEYLTLYSSSPDGEGVVLFVLLLTILVFQDSFSV